MKGKNEDAAKVSVGNFLQRKNHNRSALYEGNTAINILYY